MSYTPTNWENSPSVATPITADNLNNIETGVSSAHSQLDGRLSDGSIDVRVDQRSAWFSNNGSKFSQSRESVYGLHAVTTDGSVAGDYIMAFGLDGGGAGGILFSHKKPLGAAVRMNQNPAGGAMIEHSSEGKIPHTLMNNYVGNPGTYTRLRPGEGFSDGEVSAGSAILKSATAGFSSSDVGATVSPRQPTANWTGPGGPSVTIVSVNSPTEVTLSSPASYSNSSVSFLLGGRVPDTSQLIDKGVDYDGTTILWERRRGGWSEVTNLIPVTPSHPALSVFAGTGQTADIVRVRRGSDDMLRVTSAGSLVATGQQQFSNAARVVSTGPVAEFRRWGTAGGDSGATNVAIIGNDLSDQMRFLSADNATVQTRINKNGRLIIKHGSAPSPSELQAGEATIYLDTTEGNPRVMFAMKDSAGTFSTGPLS